jgi:4-amino-4-deoxy-L-arabinose transferase-like glycosyltransferase
VSGASPVNPHAMTRTLMRPWSRRVWLGAVIGLSLAGALHLWYLYVTHASRMSGEGAGFITYMLAMLLGFPTNLLMSLFAESPAARGTGSSGLREHYLLLLGIVINWILIVSLAGYLRRAAAGPGRTPAP